VVLCALTPNAAGSPTSATDADFLPLTSDDGSVTFTWVTTSGSPLEFSFTAPTYTGAIVSFNITVQTGSGIVAMQTFSTIGAPTRHSTLGCTGAANALNIVRHSEQVRCTINVRDATGPTTGISQDYGTPNVIPSSSLPIGWSYAESPNKQTVNFTLQAPSTPGSTFRVRGTMESNSPIFLQDFVTINVRGTPTIKSTMVCSSSSIDTLLFRIGDTITCTYFPRTGSGVRTTGFATDLMAPLMTPALVYTASPIASTDSGSTFTFSFVVPTASVSGVNFTMGDQLQLTGRLSSSTALDQGPQALVFVDVPTSQSTLHCVGALTSSAVVHTGETVVCNITLLTAGGALTTGFPSDFDTPNITAGSALTPIITQSGAVYDTVMTFTLVAPATPQSFSVAAALLSGAPLSGSPKIIVTRSYATTASTLSCAGFLSGTAFVTENELVNCTIVARDSTGLIDAIVSDFFTPAVTGGTLVSVLTAVPGNLSLVRFTVQAPAQAGTFFFVRGRLSANVVFTQPAFSITVLGLPTQLSSVACVGVVSQQTLIRAGDNATCTVLPRNGNGVRMATFAAGFGLPVVVNGDSPTALRTSDAGNSFVFTLRAYANLSANAQVTVTGTLANGTTFSTAASTLTVVGQPTVDSVLDCVSQSTGSSFVYPAQLVLCTITVRDASGATTGFADDFGRATSVGGSNIGLPVAVSGGAQMTFTLTAPATANAAFTITGTMANTSAFSQGPFSMLVIGTASRFSLLSCSAVRLQRQNVRAGEDIVCVISVRDTNNLASTALFSDFGAPAIVGGALNGALQSSSNYTQVLFNVTAPSTVGALFSITGRMTNGLLFLQGPVFFPVVGTPDATSTIACVGAISQSTSVRTNETVLCRLTMRTGGVAVTGDVTDFAAPEVEGGSSPSPLQVHSSTQLNFSTVAPAAPGAVFRMLGQLATGANFSQGYHSLNVIGNPTEQSVAECQGLLSGLLLIKANEPLLCVVYFADGSGNTTGFAPILLSLRRQR
jgi:hypothetical protein